jgi:hypothetical protein
MSDVNVDILDNVPKVTESSDSETEEESEESESESDDDN